MLKKKEIEKIKEYLNDSVNPLFLFDNDPDGFCSAIILLKSLGRGNAIPIRSFPDTDHTLMSRIEEFSPDKIFVLDKPYTNEEFLNRMQERNIEVSIIDHHEIKLTKELKTKANFFLSFPSSEPTSYLCQKIFNNKNTLWIALIGCVYDVFKPDFIEEFQKNYPNLVDSDLEISKMRYSSELGKITQILSLALKSSNISIQSFIELFLNADGPDSVLIEDKKNELLHKRYNLLNKVVEKNIRKAEVHPNLVFLEYSGEYSLSSDISNLLFFRNPDRFVAVCYKKQDWINVSLRGRDAKKFTEKIISKIENSSGGGHEVACGLRIPQVSFYEFKKILFDEFGKP